MRKIYNFPACLPESVRDIIASDAPTLGSDHETSSSWLSKFANSCYRSSIQYKGPLLYSDPLCQNLISPTIKAYKNCVKRLLCEIQSKGVTEEWEGENFWLYNVRGLRKSLRHNWSFFFELNSEFFNFLLFIIAVCRRYTCGNINVWPLYGQKSKNQLWFKTSDSDRFIFCSSFYLFLFLFFSKIKLWEFAV